MWRLRRPEGWVVAYFSARGANREAIEETAWADYEADGPNHGRSDGTSPGDLLRLHGGGRPGRSRRLAL